MESAVLWGIGVAGFGLGARWVFPAVPRAIGVAVMAMGALIAASSFLPHDLRPTFPELVYLSSGTLLLGAIAHGFVLWRSAKPQIIPLHDAVRIVRDRAPDSEHVKYALEHHKLDEQMQWIGIVLWMIVPLHFKMPISAAYRPVTYADRDTDLFFEFADGRARLTDLLGHTVACDDIAISRSNMNKAIKKLRTEALVLLDKE